MSSIDPFIDPPSKASDGPAFKNALGNSGRLKSKSSRRKKSPVAELASPSKGRLPSAGTAQAKITWDKKMSDAMRGMK
jgi:hypothetical protein